MQWEAHPTPVVFTHSPASQWGCSRWTLRHLLAAVPAVQAKTMHDAKGHEFPFFAADAPLASSLGLVAPYDEAIRPPGAVLAQLEHASPPLYAAGPVEEVLPPAVLAGSIGDPADLWGEAPPASQHNVWMAGDGVVAAMHYDVAHNFVLQVQGQKRFELLPPAAHRGRLYPSSHPYRRHALPGVARDALRVTLNPGEVLYLPPFWLHRVSSLGPQGTLSLNTWFESAAGAALSRALATALPFEAHWPPARTRWAAALLVAEVASRVQGGGAAGAAALEELRRRYDGLDGPAGAASCGEAGGPHEAAAIVQSPRVDEVAALLGSVGDPDVRATLLLQYVESVLSFAAQGGDLPALVNCL